MSGLAARGASSSTPFTVSWPPPAPRVSSARAAAIAVSLLMHVALLLVVAATWQREQRLELPPPPRVRVTMLNRPQLPAARAPAPPAPAPAPPAPTQPRHRPPPKRHLPVPRPLEPQQEAPAEPVVITEEPARADADATASLVATESGGLTALAGSAALGSGDGVPAGLPEPPPPISPERRQLMLASYLQEVFRSRIAARFRYPDEAERLGMEGLVIVRASVLSTGALASARTLGACAHRILCAAAERTVREAAPFPPPPAELGGSISIDVPLNYRLE